MVIRELLGMRDAKLAAALVAALLAALAMGLTFAAGPAKANHTCTIETIDGTRVCVPNEHTPPTVGADNASRTANEGQTATNTGTFSDPDGNASVTLSASVGSVTKNDTNGTWSWSFNTSDGPDQSQTVTITASDGTDAVSTTFSLTVNNVAPTVRFAGSGASTTEGGAFADGYHSTGFSFSVSDPGNDTWTTNTGCGANGSEWQESSSVVWCGFFDGPGSAVVSASATDSDGTTGNTATLNITVTNRNPFAVLNAPTSIDEGAPATVSLTNGGSVTPQDAQHDLDAGLRYAFDCNGGSLAAATYEGSSTSNSTTCSYDDGPGTKTVRARVIDKDGGFNEYTKTITVNNANPTATFEAPASAEQGSNFDISLANVRDASNADTASLSYALDCGNGSGYVSSSTTSKTCAAIDQPSLTVKGKVTDKDGGTNEYTKTVSVNNVAPTGTIKVNGDAATTSSATVSLTLSAMDPLPGSGVGHMRFRNENTEVWSAWEPYSTSRSWLLSSGEGAKTVHVQYKDNAQNISATTISDGIQLDTTPPPPPPPPPPPAADTTKPTVTGMSPRHRSTTRDTTPSIRAVVRDNATNLQKANVKLYVNGKRITRFSYSAATDRLVYNSPKLAKGKKTVKVVANDAAGNFVTKSWYFTIG